MDPRRRIGKARSVVVDPLVTGRLFVAVPVYGVMASTDGGCGGIDTSAFLSP